MAGTRASDMPDLEQLIRRHERLVLGTAYRLLGNLEDAQDAAQEVLVRLLKYRRRFDEDRELAPWLYRITVNVCHDLRRRRRELPLADAGDPAAAEPAPFGALEIEQRQRLLRRGLKVLSEKERAAVVLRDIEGLPTAEVARILQSTEATVRSQVSMARLKLRDFCDRALKRRV